MRIGFNPDSYMIGYDCDRYNLKFNVEIQIRDENVAQFNAMKVRTIPCEICGQRHTMIARKPIFSRAA